MNDEKKQNSFTFFRNYYETILMFEKMQDQDQFLRSIMAYVFEDIEPSFTNPIMRQVWLMFKPNLDKSKRGFKTLN